MLLPSELNKRSRGGGLYADTPSHWIHPVRRARHCGKRRSAEDGIWKAPDQTVLVYRYTSILASYHV
jgi:hypothetical protein